MKKSEVPQDEASTYAGQHKLMYAVDDAGRYAGVPSCGWEVESAATREAIATIQRERRAAWERARRGESSPLEYHMYSCRMDIALLAQTTGLFQWRIRRHLQPAVFARLSDSLIARYCDALGMNKQQLQAVPEILSD